MSLLTQPHEVAGAVDRMVALIVELFQPDEVILFGSRARGDAEQLSDVDLLVVLPDDRYQPDIDLEILRRLPRPEVALDLLVIPRSAMDIKSEIWGTVFNAARREGQVLYAAHQRPAGTLDWYERAAADLEDARQLVRSRPSSENVVWLAQQAAEKSIKALLIQHQIQFRYIHSLEALRQLLPPGLSVAAQPPDLNKLSQIAISTRYSAVGRVLDPTFVEESIQLAQEVLDMVKLDLDPLVVSSL